MKNPASFPAGQEEGVREQRELRTADRVLILLQRSASGKISSRPPARQAGAESRKRKAPPWSDGAKVVILDGRVGERRRPYSFWRAEAGAARQRKTPPAYRNQRGCAARCKPGVEPAAPSFWRA